MRHASLLAPLPSAEAMRHADRAAAGAGLGAFTLMETAGRGAARVLRAAFPDARRVLVVCGAGGNGGDGFVVARALAEAGVAVGVVLAAPRATLAPPSARHLAVLEALAPDLPGALTVRAYDGPASLGALGPVDLLVDALAGTGGGGRLRAPYPEIARWMNAHPAPTAALDVPSGLDADTGAVPGGDDGCVRAALTVTFGAAKPGLRLGQGAALAGRVVRIGVGLPRGLLDRMIAEHGGAHASTDAWARASTPIRAPDAHKYSAGLALVVAGSEGMTGAPFLAAQAAARVGAGYVRLGAPAGLLPVLAAKLTEVSLLGLPGGTSGLDPAGALRVLAPILAKADALLVGPGLGRAPNTRRAVRRLLERYAGPAVVDADGLAALDPAWLAAHRRPGDPPRLVLTPHAGELARLAGEPVDLADRLGVARRYAEAWRCVLVVKGMPSLIGVPAFEGAPARAFVCGRSSVALATAGTGDVLAGMIAGLLAQGLPPADAALAALHIGALAARGYARRHAPASMQASDLVGGISRALHACAPGGRGSLPARLRPPR